MDNPNLSPDRIKILKKIDEFERKENWHVDVENDPPAPVLMPEQIDYLNKKLKNKIGSFVANRVARKFYENEIRKGHMSIENVFGLENFQAVKDGAILTCNHFNVYDNYVVFKSLQKSLKRRKLYKVIREGNYTNFPGLFGYMFKHCNTLPLSSNFETMKKFMSAVKILLEKGEKILVYPEQSMWWNYRKPRPFKMGAFNLAATNNVPIIPCFITTRDSEKMAPDGSFYLIYTMHIMPAIYPDKDKTIKENVQGMSQKNQQLWREKYEEVYKIPLTYLSKDDN